MNNEPDEIDDFDRFIDLGPALISGVIDNSEKGRISGHLVLAGLDSPLELRLQGNAAPDLAGCVVRFRREMTMRLEPEDAEILKSPNHGAVVRVSAAAHEEWEEEDGSRLTRRRLEIDWLHFGTLTRFVIGVTDCEFDIDLPSWTPTDEDITQQREDLKSANALFAQLVEEFEEDGLDEAIREDQFEKIDAILHELEALETDEQRLSRMREALGPDAGEHELRGLLEAYFSEDFGSASSEEDDLKF